MGQCHLDSSISELRCLASRTIFNDSPLARMVMGFMIVFLFGCSSLLTGELILYCSKISSNLLILSCK